MKTQHYIFSLLTTFTISSAQARLAVHEWGTFTSLVGSNGKTQHGMYHEDERLPDFVHGFGETLSSPPGTASFFDWDRTVSGQNPMNTAHNPNCPRHSKSCMSIEVLNSNFISQKMETPVIYFYSDRTQPVKVNVKFPQGAVTETYPAPVATRPTRQDRVLSQGDTTFEIEVLSTKSEELKPVDPSNIYSHARNVQSNIVRAGNETEKFIFYRGLGHYQPRLRIRSEQDDLFFLADKGFEPQFTFLVDVNASGHAQMMLVRGVGSGKEMNVSGEAIRQLKNHQVRESNEVMSGVQMSGNLHKALLNAGLFDDEALAMIATWNSGYFKTPGLRVLYILSRDEVDQVLPLEISPAPDNLKRAFVGRIEVLRQNEELEILKNIANLGRSFKVSSLGRFAEPILRRVLEVYRSTRDGGLEGKLEPIFRELISQAQSM